MYTLHNNNGWSERGYFKIEPAPDPIASCEKGKKKNLNKTIEAVFCHYSPSVRQHVRVCRDLAYTCVRQKLQ